MRNIIINRKKSFVGCIGKISIYTIHQLNEDEAIPKEKFHYLGSIKNGSFLKTTISEEEITVVAAYDSLGVFMITDYIVIPKGVIDIVLDGKTKLNPARGNPFIFERKY